MIVFLAQIVLGARNNDFEGWTQILVIVIMAVIYGLSGIIKAAKSKKLEGKEEQQGGSSDKAPVSPSARRGEQDKQPLPAGTVTRRVYQTKPQPQQPKPSQAKLVVQKQAQPTEPQVKPKLAMPTTKLQAKKPKLKPEIEELPEFAVKGLEDKQTRTAIPSEEISKVPYLDEPLLDVSDPESLRRAILHYEILGKPLSLR